MRKFVDYHNEQTTNESIEQYNEDMSLSLADMIIFAIATPFAPILARNVIENIENIRDKISNWKKNKKYSEEIKKAEAFIKPIKPKIEKLIEEIKNEDNIKKKRELKNDLVLLIRGAASNLSIGHLEKYLKTTGVSGLNQTKAFQGSYLK